jgi:hypothetical protein
MGSFATDPDSGQPQVRRSCSPATRRRLYGSRPRPTCSSASTPTVYVSLNPIGSFSLASVDVSTNDREQKREILYHVHHGAAAFLRGEASTFHLRNANMQYAVLPTVCLLTPGGQRERESGGILRRCVGPYNSKSITDTPHSLTQATFNAHSQPGNLIRTYSRRVYSVPTCLSHRDTRAVVGRMQVPWFPALLASPRSSTTPPCARWILVRPISSASTAGT